MEILNVSPAYHDDRAFTPVNLRLAWSPADKTNHGAPGGRLVVGTLLRVGLYRATGAGTWEALAGGISLRRHRRRWHRPLRQARGPQRDLLRGASPGVVSPRGPRRMVAQGRAVEWCCMGRRPRHQHLRGQRVPREAHHRHSPSPTRRNDQDPSRVPAKPVPRGSNDSQAGSIGD